MESIKKSLIIPINSQSEILIQDRRNFKKPDWGFFGGGIEEGETPLEAVLRETKEELGLDLNESDIISMGTSTTFWEDNKPQIRGLYLYKTDQKSFEDLEADGAHWLTFKEARKRLDINDRFDEIVEMIKKAI